VSSFSAKLSQCREVIDYWCQCCRHVYATSAEREFSCDEFF